MVIGAMTTQHELLASDLARAKVPILQRDGAADRRPAGALCGTIGGNVANGDPGNDMPAVMQCLGRGLSSLHGQERRRGRSRRASSTRAPTSPRSRAGEILTAIRIPAPPAGHGWAYEKLKRKVGDYATAAAAVVLTLQGGRVRAAASIGLTNVGRDAALGRGGRAGS